MPSWYLASLTLARALARSRFFSRARVMRSVIVGSPKTSHQLASFSGVSSSDTFCSTKATG